MPIETKIEEAIEEQNQFKIKDIGILITNLVSLAIISGTILCLVFLIWGGIDWLSSEGDPEKVKKAGQKITAALMGLGVIVLSWLIWQLALYFLGIGEVSGGRVILRLPSLIPTTGTPTTNDTLQPGSQLRQK